MNMPRMLIETYIAAPFGPVRVMTTHLEYFSGELRALAVEAIRAAHMMACSREATPRDAGAGPYIRQPETRSAILTGDFNMRPRDPTRLRLLAPLPDGYPAFLDAWTVRHGETPHPHSFCIADQRYGAPHCADYIFVTPDLADRVIDVAYDLETRLSDHQPVDRHAKRRLRLIHRHQQNDGSWRGHPDLPGMVSDRKNEEGAKTPAC